MDPYANMQEQAELASGIAHRDRTADEILDDAVRLAELVLALAEWLEKGGFPPFQEQPRGPMSLAQGMALARRVGPDTSHFNVVVGPFDLPDGYVQATFDDGFTCGISREGDVSS